MKNQKQKLFRFVSLGMTLLLFTGFFPLRISSVSAEAAFGSPTTYSMNDGPGTIVSADFDQDGFPDISTLHANVSNISVRLNNGDGTFGPANTYTSGAAISLSGFTADLNNDSYPDIMSGSSSSLHVYLNNGDGTFASSVSYPTGTQPVGIFAADFDMDGDHDAVTSNVGSNTVSFLENNGDGTFALPVQYPAGLNTYSLIGGDFDHDGDFDVAATNNSSGNVTVLLNNGDATFAAGVDYPTPVNPTTIQTGDINQDGDLDLVIVASGVVSVLNGNGDGTFDSAVNYSVASGPFSIDLGDFENDGDLDIVTVDTSSNTYSYLLNDGTGVFGTATSTNIGLFGSMVVVQDFDRDGDQEFAISHFTTDDFSIVLNTGTNTGTGVFGTAVDYATGGSPRSVFTADFNNDGRHDLVTSNDGVAELNVAFNSGTGTFGAFTDYSLTNPAYNVFSADVDNNGWSDLLATIPTSGELAVLLNDGTGLFGTASYYAAATAPFGLFSGDFNNDAKIDVAVVNSTSVSVLLNSGAGVFAAAVNYSIGATNARGVYGGDFDKDGDMDLAAGGSNNIRVFFNDGSGGFGSTSDLSTGGPGPKTVFAADLDKDGDVDLAFTRESGGAVDVYTNNGTGSFTGPSSFFAGFVNRFISGGDFDNDGDVDLTVVNSSGGNDDLFVLSNDGTGAFNTVASYASSVPHGVAVADFNVDGKMDIAASGFSGNVSIFLNDPPNTAPVLGFAADDVIPKSQVSQSIDGLGVVTVNFKVRDAESNAVTLKDFEFSTDNGSSWSPVLIGSASFGGGWPNNTGSNYSTSLAFGSTYNFTVDTQHVDLAALNSLDSTQVRFRFKGNDGNSDSAFVATEAFHLDNESPSASVVFPDGGENLVSGSTVQVRWNSIDDSSSAPVTLELSTDNGVNFSPIPLATNLTNNDGVYTEDGVTWGGSGGGNGQFNQPSGIDVDSDGNVYVVDCCNERIQVFTPGGTYLRQWGSGGSGDGQFDGSTDLAIDADDNVYVVDRFNHRIQKFSKDGTFLMKWGTSGSGNGEFSFPTGIGIDSLNRIYIADTFNDRIQLFDTNGVYLSSFGTSGSGDGEFDRPQDVAIDRNSGDIYVAEGVNDRIQRFDSSFVFLNTWGNTGGGVGEFFEPSRLVVDPVGQVIVSDIDSSRVQGFDSDGNFLFNLSVNSPEGLGLGHQGYLYVGNVDFFLIERFSARSGYFDWSVPVVDTTEALVKVISSDALGNTVEDVSDAVFTILETDPAGAVEIHVVSTNAPGNDKSTGISDGPGTDDITSFYQTAEYSGARKYVFDTNGVPSEIIISVDLDTIPSPTSLALNDDEVSAPIALPFPVEMFGRENNSIVVSSNGFIYLNETDPTSTDDGCCSGDLMSAQTISDGDDHLIAGVWSDLYPPGNGVVEYGVVGSAPNRVFVVSFDNVSQCCDGNGGNTFQIKLFETAPPMTPGRSHFSTSIREEAPASTIGGSVEDRTVKNPSPASSGMYESSPVMSPTRSTLSLFQALRQLFAWMNPDGFQMTSSSEKSLKAPQRKLQMKKTLKLLASVAGYSDGYFFNKPEKEPMENVAELMKSLMISFSACYTPAQLDRATRHDTPENDYWWAGYWHFLDPFAQKFFGAEYALWDPIDALNTLEATEVFLKEYCAKNLEQ